MNQFRQDYTNLDKSRPKLHLIKEIQKVGLPLNFGLVFVLTLFMGFLIPVMSLNHARASFKAE